MNQKKLALKHYNFLKPLTCMVVSGDISTFCTVLILDEMHETEVIRQGDPLFIGMEDEQGKVEPIGGVVIAAYKNKKLLISSDKMFHDFSEKRVAPRQAVSLMGDMTPLESSGKRREVAIKDISYAGVRVYSDEELEVGETVKLDILWTSSVVTLLGRVARRCITYDRMEYGIELIHRDMAEINSTKDTFEKIVAFETELLQKCLSKLALAAV